MNGLRVNDTSLQDFNFNAELFNRFINYTDVKETTLKGYTTCLKAFALWLHGNNIKCPVREDIKAYKQYLNDNDYAAGTKAQYLRAVKHFFKWTASEGLYPNIADNIKTVKVRADNSKKEAFAESDILAVLQSIDRTREEGKRNYAMILLSLTGGLRIIEMQRANIEDMQIIRGQRVLYIQGKGHDSKDDYIKIIPEVYAAITDYLSVRAYKKNEPLFTGTSNRAKGQRLTEPSISRIIKNVFKDAGFDCDKLTAHSLRHSSNTFLFKAGADLYQVQQHARHQDPKTTEIYLHTTERDEDTSEQQIYNQMLNPQHNDNLTDAFEQLKNLSYEKQLEAIEFINQLAALKEVV